MAARHAVANSTFQYLQRYQRALRDPFAWLVGQVLTFFGVSLYVKYVELRLTPAYADSWRDTGRTLVNAWDYLLFSTQEIAVFAALLAGVALARSRLRSGLAWRTSAWLFGLFVLPFLSLVEVLGLAHFALFLTPIGPSDLRMIGWSGHLLSAGHVMQSSGVPLGLLTLVVAYYCTPPRLWLGRPHLVRLIRPRALTFIVATAGALLLLPKPHVDDVLLAPHPTLWLAFGSRPEGLFDPSTPAAAADSPLTTTHGRLAVTEHPTNVLILMLESTRAASVALYSPTATAGRELLDLRDDIVVFDQVYAPVPTSAHALFSILYGVYPYLGPFWMTDDKAVVAESMAEHFAGKGYATHLYATADLNFDEVGTFATRGFERVRDPNDWPGQEAYTLLEWGRDDRLLFEEIKTFLTSDRTQPFFLLAFTSNQHHPYAADQLLGGPPATSPHDAYEQLVAYDLRQVADLYRWMKARGVADNTLILVVGDHGEAFGEHPGNFGHAAFIYEENVHVPCFILHPRRLGLPRHVAQLGSQVDMRATIADILGWPEPQPTDGVSLLLRSPDRTLAHFTENGVSHFGMRDERFSYISTPNTAERLYDRRTDPQEAHDLGALYPRVTAMYRERLQRWEAQHQLALARVMK